MAIWFWPEHPEAMELLFTGMGMSSLGETWKIRVSFCKCSLSGEEGTSKPGAQERERGHPVYAHGASVDLTKGCSHVQMSSDEDTEKKRK